jgi:hypothetical protein
MVGLTANRLVGPDRLAPSSSVRRHRTGSPTVSGLELFFDILLGVVAVVIAWFAIFSVMKLYQGQR